MSEQNSIKGQVEVILPVETFPSGFQKQVLVVNTMGEYPQQVPVEFIKDKISILANLQVGQPVLVHVNIRGNEYNGKYYANIQGWKIDTQSQQEPQQEQPAIDPNQGGESLPF